MPINKRKKNSRQRGSHTHGWGAMKKHRGAGNRGGRGMAGTGKRGDAKKPRIWGDRYFGKKGFKKKGSPLRVHPINLIDLELKKDNYVQESKAVKNDGVYVFDLHKLGFTKLLSTFLSIGISSAFVFFSDSFLSVFIFSSGFLLIFSDSVIIISPPVICFYF